MTDTNSTQTAVDETNAPAAPGATGTDAQTNGGDDLDTLLAEYDDSKKAPPQTTKQPEPNAGAGDDIRALTEKVNGLLSEHQQVSFKRDMETTIKDVRGDLNPEYFDNDFVQSWIDAQARSDPRLSTAWANRHANPKQFQKVVDTLGRSFTKKYGKLPDSQATEDRAAVTAAVRGTSTKAPEGKAPSYGGMSNPEFRQSVKSQYGFDPGV